jgi:hypothetical protein
MTTRWIALALFVVIFLASCGAEDRSNHADGGSTGTGISHGSITAIGSISVNGVKFDTGDAKIIVEGDEVGVGDLAVIEHLAKGHVVTVEGLIQGGSGKALRVKFKNQVKGPVTQVLDVDFTTKQLVVLGQTVIIDDHTAYKATSFDDVVVENFVEVSGFIDDMGVIYATHFKKKADVFDPNEEVKVKGTISDMVPPIFKINALTVDYSSVNKLPLGGPAEGQFVEVKGMLDASGVLIAAKVELEDELGADDADRVELEGFVTSFVSAEEFTVGNQPVQTNTGTQYEGGVLFEVALGVKLEVEGVLVNGVLIANEVSFRDNAKLKSNVATIMPDLANPATGTLTLQGFGGITVIVNELTEIKENAQTLADIAAGNYVEVRGRATGATPTVTVAAREIKVKEFDTGEPNIKIELQGPVDDVNAPFITILGIKIDTGTAEAFEGIDDMKELTPEQFFAMVMVGDVVKVDGRLVDTTSGIVDWKKIEFEDDD